LSTGVATVAALTRGIRSFALYPYLFAEIETARQLAGLSEGQAQFWVGELESPQCARRVAAGVREHPDLDAQTTSDFARMTQDYWIFGSGAGGALAFAALFSLLVGGVIVAQTLYSITREHDKELATLKAMGATRAELIAFVAWQASFLALSGGATGVALAMLLSQMLVGEGIDIALTRPVFVTGTLAITCMCAAASVPSARRVLRVEAAEVFR
jgi:putative ABC transport system permease protein